MNLSSYIKLGLVAAFVATLWAAHQAGRADGQAEVQARWDKARLEAQDKQDKQVDQATETLVQEVEVIKTVYRDRMKEVVKYVPSPGANCPADPDFVRLFNATR